MENNLILDIGNSRAKVAVMSGSEVVMGRVAESVECFDFEAIVREWQPSRAIVSSTRCNGVAAAEMLRRLVPEVFNFDDSLRLPLEIDYAKTLGRDRIAAAVGARKLCPESNLLVIDLGTAITIDVVTAEGVFAGGYISPGVRTRLQSLSSAASALPLCEAREVSDELPHTTKDAIEIGVMLGIELELEGHIARFSKKYDNLTIFLSGGDAFFFDKRIKNTIFADRELVSRGLNTILEYNAD